MSQHSNPARTRRVRDLSGGKWFFIHNALLRDGWGAKVGSSGVAIYAALALHADARTQVCWPSYQTLADLIGISRAHAIEAVKALERYNLVQVRRAHGQTNEYSLLDPDQWGNNQPDSEVDEVVNLVDHLGDGSHSGLPPGVNRSDSPENGSHSGLPEGVNRCDSNKTHEQDSQKEQDQNVADDALASTWRAVLADLKLRTTKAIFDARLRQTRAVKQENGVLTVAVPDERVRQWCAGRLVRLVQRSVCYVTCEDLEIEFRVADASRGEGHQSGLE